MGQEPGQVMQLVTGVLVNLLQFARLREWRCLYGAANPYKPIAASCVHKLRQGFSATPVAYARASTRIRSHCHSPHSLVRPTPSATTRILFRCPRKRCLHERFHPVSFLGCALKISRVHCCNFSIFISYFCLFNQLVSIVERMVNIAPRGFFCSIRSMFRCER